MCERYIDWLPLKRPQLGTCPATQACALTRNQTSNLRVCGMMPKQLSHTNQFINHFLSACICPELCLVLGFSRGQGPASVVLIRVEETNKI